MNTICQGSAADLIKIAMNNIYRQLKEIKSSAVLLVQIHDELVYEVKQDEVLIVQVVFLLSDGRKLSKTIWRTL